MGVVLDHVRRLPKLLPSLKEKIAPSQFEKLQSIIGYLGSPPAAETKKSSKPTATEKQKPPAAEKPKPSKRVTAQASNASTPQKKLQRHTSNASSMDDEKICDMLNEFDEDDFNEENLSNPWLSSFL